MTQLEKKIRKIFSCVDQYSEDPNSDAVQFFVGHDGVNYEKLKNLSDLLETSKITFPSVDFDEYYGESNITIRAVEVKYRPLEESH
jgi:hypothetical protein